MDNPIALTGIFELVGGSDDRNDSRIKISLVQQRLNSCLIAVFFCSISRPKSLSIQILRCSWLSRVLRQESGWWRLVLSSGLF